MTSEELAKRLNGRTYGKEISDDEAGLAKENSLVVVHGASDDLIEFRGAIYNELGAWEGATIYVSVDGKVYPDSHDCDCPYCGFKEVLSKSKSIQALA